ncbi:uncharacterized protein LOC109720064 [Ananas comosus]|uniref:Uncharacterized protein LOC109720064 n=1 Tax=Ananas comosus TaxID=4615 RepID=A0A6P5G3X2_ANACO|nr:uncharacterized protein LOC109720064 [Ananas comosus]
MAMATSTKSRSSNFLYQVLTLPTKNTRLFLPLFTIITLINFIFILCNFFSMQPLSADIALKAKALVHTDPTSPDYSLLVAAIQKEANELFFELIIYTVIAFLVNSFLRIITFFAVAVTCSGELLTLRELLVKTKRNMKGPIITHLFGVLLVLLCVLPLILITLFPLFIKKLGSYTLIMLSILVLVLFLLAIILLLYLSIVWPLSMAVSVVETGCYGPGAFKRAAELAKEKKMKGFLIILASFLLVGALYAINNMILKYSPSSSAASVLVLGFFYTFIGELVGMYVLIAVVIYYYECKKSRGEGEEEQALKSGDFVYKMVPTKAVHVDEELP